MKIPGKIKRLPAGLTRRAKYAVGQMVFHLRGRVIKYFVIPAIYSRKLRNYVPETPFGRKPRILLFHNKYAVSNGQRLGDSYELHTVVSPLKNADVAEVVEYCYDLDHFDGPMGDSKLVDLVIKTRPDLMVFSAYNDRNRLHPNFDVLRNLRSKCHMPIVIIWCDSIDKKPIGQFLRMSKSVDLNVLMDSETLVRDYPAISQHLRLWTPTDHGVFHPCEGPQDIDVSFIGSTGSYRSIREPFLDHLRESGVNVVKTGGQHTPVSLQEYADIMRRSKISINFSHSLPGTHQLKARVFEILLSGSLMLESKNPETPKFFRPMVDYVEYDSKEDMAEKARYYLEHEEEREQIANSGYKRMVSKYNHDIFWDRIMSKLTELDALSGSFHGQEARV